jgi:starch synthase (maltosyl-transferring)
MSTRSRGSANGSTRRRAPHAASATLPPATPASPPPFGSYPAIVIEGVAPEIDGGRWPIKRVVGDMVEVGADIFKEGHDLLRARVLYRGEPRLGAPDGVAATEWQSAPMQPQGNDRWTGRFPVTEIGRYFYTVEAFTDVFGSWRADLEKRVAADQDVASDLLEGRRLVEQAIERASSTPPGPTSPPRLPDSSGAGVTQASREASHAAGLARRLSQMLKRWDVDVATSAELAELMAAAPDTTDATRYRHQLELIVDRTAARFAAWYEIFPRSQGTDPRRGATFVEAEARLPAIASMGFDVLYMTPIHPIGTTNRKGPNNSLVAGPDDPGSPYAIGSPAGGHDAIAPELGTLDDFLHFQTRARELGLELALDFAIQVSPDHPWVKEHPDWFYHRPDGTIKFAENPPKKYEDIYPLNFRSADWKSLWAALRDVVLFWAGHGVRTFRVDNPHTKPLAFWEWLIRDVQQAYPDTIFLAEAFTRPKVMQALAKAGFTQSYTYFTWRSTRAELTEYLADARVLPRQLLRQHARHPAARVAAGRSARLPHAAGAGGDPIFGVRHLQRL